MMRTLLAATIVSSLALARAGARQPAPPATPTDVKPGSITCEDVEYPIPTSYLRLTASGQAVRIAFMFPGLGHVPHMEAHDKTYPPLVAFFGEGVTDRQAR